MNEIELLQKSIEAKPAEIEHQLASAMRGIGRRIVQAPEIVRALTAADQIPAGVVVTSDEQAAEMADLVAQVIDGERRLAAETSTALRIPRQMEAAVKSAIEPAKAALTVAKLRGNDARVQWQQECRRRAAKAEQEQREAAARAAAEAALEAEAVGEDAPPVAEVAAVEVPRVVSGGVGKAGTTTRIDVGEVVDWSVVPHEWLMVSSAVARAVFLSAVLEKKVARPQPGESVTYCGVRFTCVEYAANRR